MRFKRKLPVQYLLAPLLLAVLVLVFLWSQGVVGRGGDQGRAIPAPPALPPGATTARVQAKIIPREQVYAGYVEAIDPVEITPRVMARIVELRYREGDDVLAEEVLIKLDDRDVRARRAQVEASLEGARAEALRAELFWVRSDKLHRVEALTTQDWETARAAYRRTKAMVQRVQETLEEARTAQSWLVLKAPRAGRVLSRMADPGDMAVAGRPVMALYQPDQLRFRVAVPEERAPDSQPGRSLQISFDGLPDRSAKVIRILPATDTRTGTVTLHLALAAANDLRPGRFGRLHLVVGEQESLLIPASAVERVGQVERVHLVRDGRIHLVTVRSGKRHGDMVEVLSGLRIDEEVWLR